MRSGVIAQKVGMTRIFTDAGEHIPVTVLRLDKCQVLGLYKCRVFRPVQASGTN